MQNSVSSKKEEDIFIRHLMDLSNRAYNRGFPVFSDFMGLKEISIFLKNSPSFPSDHRLYGGYDDAERLMACFFPKDTEISEDDYPISCIGITGVSAKADADFGHRDILGSLMGLSIKRGMIGDIIKDGNTDDYYFLCVDNISDFILNELTSIKRSNVILKKTRLKEAALKREFKEKQITVSSLRLDSIVSAVLNISRGNSSDLISSGKVFLNGEETLNNSKQIKDSDIISVRGWGKFKVTQTERKTRKDRSVLNAYIYK